MTDFTYSEARLFRANVESSNQIDVRGARAGIRVAMLKDHALREAVDEDVQALCREAVKRDGFADAATLTREGYSLDVALHFAERLAAAHRAASLKAAPRFDRFTDEGEAA